ncbi:hypothetical protein MTO96_002418 [Rhipicephalus appendiculatus]
MYAYITKVEYSRSTEFLKDGDVILGWNPVAHICGFIIPMIAFLSGAMVVPSKGGLSPEEFVDIVNTHKITSVCAFPTALRKLVFQLDEGLVPSLKRIIISGTCSSEDLYDRILQVFQLESLRNGYGMSESAGFICIPAPNTTGYRGVGYPLPLVEYKIIDSATGRHLGPCEVGEITFRAPHLMRGYYKRPDETAQVLNEQRWFRSGDAGYYDHSGQLYVVERLKDMIKCLDQQVAPAEIETLLTQHPLVLEAAVVGINNPEFGEAPTAFVVIDPSAKGLVSEEELVQLVSVDDINQGAEPSKFAESNCGYCTDNVYENDRCAQSGTCVWMAQRLLGRTKQGRWSKMNYGVVVGARASGTVGGGCRQGAHATYSFDDGLRKTANAGFGAAGIRPAIGGHWHAQWSWTGSQEPPSAVELHAKKSRAGPNKGGSVEMSTSLP